MVLLNGEPWFVAVDLYSILFKRRTGVASLSLSLLRDLHNQRGGASTLTDSIRSACAVSLGPPFSRPQASLMTPYRYVLDEQDYGVLNPR
ncbi:hypothetical protein H721_00292 [Brucella ovis IntaBari-2006-46-332]|nr:hypothetical protein C010_00264 [Brucella ovis 80/125]ENR10549.1 hypothetical protein C961_00266 [Brucella ovis F8/05B]ENS96453.1 hypothetical protein B999_00602 [Brucella ovis 63/96]ENT01470.1 hypothetical protein C009_00281 [Brucella ovis 81/8]ENT79850.1 hypothetical protein H712_00262 [Brucella ovis IntaBari-2009-88-4]ENT83083.1 hypothetical protein H720_00267 [Brucella ovis IntaBari-2006-46-348]ENT84942.1 hypothetical protein H713_00263 [Brucella ovis IntaBari-2010-47-268]ENT90643.1 h